MKNLLLFAFICLLFSSCSHVATMKSVGTSLDKEGDLTIYFKHKDKIAYAVKQPYIMIDEANSETEILRNYKNAYLSITSTDKEKIDRIVLVSGITKIDIKTENFHQLGEREDDNHDHNQNSEAAAPPAHRKWHILTTNKFKNGLPNINQAFLNNMQDEYNSETRLLALTPIQQNFVKHDPVIKDYYFELPLLNDPRFSSLTTSLYKGNPVISYLDGGLDYVIVDKITDAHIHHFVIRFSGNAIDVRRIFTSI